MMSAITPDQALERLLGAVRPLDVEEVPWTEAFGRALGEEVIVRTPVPPFTNAAMDGYALRADDTVDAMPDRPVRLRVVGHLPAGRAKTGCLMPGTALRILTGAPLPDGADAVVPQERVRCDGEVVSVMQPVKRGGDVRPSGEDWAPGSVALAAGSEVGARALAVLASLGQARVRVHRRARVAVVTTGDELVDVGAPLGAGQIRDSNLPGLWAFVRELRAEPLLHPRIPDRPEVLAEVVASAVAQADVVLTTGGVSVGDRDPVKPALEVLGAESLFWKVAQKPGAPLGAWRLNGRIVLGLPGNPVAALLMAELYGWPLLRKLMGFRRHRHAEATASFVEGWRRGRADGRVHFLRVRFVPGEGGDRRVTLAGPQGSGILSTLLRAEAIARIEADQPDVPPGGSVRLLLPGWDATE